MMLRDPRRLQQLIAEYGRMRALDGYTPQSRGQRLNGLVADMLMAWGINANADLRSHGEIDVAFELAGRHFVVEAKWGSTRTDTGAVAKLQKRLRQRLGGTVGLIISIAGFTPKALADLKDGEQLMVLCLMRRHLEAMLAGFIPPEELIGELVKKASRRGIGFTEIEDLFERPYHSEMAPRFEHPPEIDQLIVESVSNFSAEVVVSALPYGQSGVAELSPGHLLLTTTEGVFQVALNDQAVSPFLNIPNCSRNPLVTPDGSVYVVRRAGVARITDGRLEIVAGGLPGNVCLSRGSANTVWAFSNGSPQVGSSSAPPSAVRIGDGLGSQTMFPVDYPPAEAHVAANVDDRTMLICGVAGITLISPADRREIVSARNNPLTNPGGLTRLAADSFLIACDSVELWELTLTDGELRKVAKLKLNGSGGELTTSGEGGGYLSCCYTDKSRTTRGVVVRWVYPCAIANPA